MLSSSRQSTIQQGLGLALQGLHEEETRAPMVRRHPPL
jgi:hypothetical protein